MQQVLLHPRILIFFLNCISLFDVLQEGRKITKKEKSLVLFGECLAFRGPDGQGGACSGGVRDTCRNPGPATAGVMCGRDPEEVGSLKLGAQQIPTQLP